MKSVLISTRPNWCEKICRKIGEENGIPVYLKPVEVRKSAPKEVPFKAYLYCSNGRFDITDIDDLTSESVRVVSEGRGKVIGEFICDEVYIRPANTLYYGKGKEDYLDLIKSACMTEMQVLDYMGGKFNRDTYFWHITDLKIYDKPKELGEFVKPCPYGASECMYDDRPKCYDCDRTITRPPQSWQYIEPLDK